MNQKGFANIILVIAIVAVLIGTGTYFVLNRQAHLTTNPTPTPAPGTPAAGLITINGKTTCLTKKGSGQQTLECSIGLQGTDGRNYVLKGYSDPEYKFAEGGLDVRVSGIFTPGEVKAADGNKYDVIGTIDVTLIKEAATFEQSNSVLSIDSLSPKQGPVGTKITIRGTRFNTRGNVVAFGPVNIGGIDSPDRMTISFTIPSFGSSSCTAGDPTMCTRDAISIFPGEYKVVVKTTEGISNGFLFIVTQ